MGYKDFLGGADISDILSSAKRLKEWARSVPRHPEAAQIMPNASDVTKQDPLTFWQGIYDVVSKDPTIFPGDMGVELASIAESRVASIVVQRLTEVAAPAYDLNTAAKILAMQGGIGHAHSVVGSGGLGKSFDDHLMDSFGYAGKLGGK